MLNMKAMPATRGAGLAAYLWKEATSLDTPTPWTAKSELDISIEEGADYDELVEIAFSERLARVQATMPPPEPWHALHGLSEVGIDHELLRDKARDDVDAALDRYETAQEQRITGVEYRHDTAPDLAALLKIDPTAPPQLADLKHLLSAMAADGQNIQGRFYRKDRSDQMTMGSLSLIFSADKSVSSVFGLASSEERQAIVNAQRSAVDTAMRQIAEQAGRIRSRRDGVDKRDPADLTWVQWQHRQSRRGDPQLHTHVTLLNVVRSRVDGKVGTLDTFLLHGFYPKAREVYHRALATELDKLGLATKFDDRIPAAVLTNVPEIVVRHFSGRSADAEAWLRQDNVNFATMSPRERSLWLGYAAAKTRPPQGMFYVPGNGHAAWHARAAGQGYVPPAQFIDPRILQQFNVVKTTVSEAERRLAGIVPPPTPPRSPKRQNEQHIHRHSEAEATEHKQRGWWKYDELQKAHGLYHGHKL